MKTKIICF